MKILYIKYIKNEKAKGNYGHDIQNLSPGKGEGRKMGEIMI